MKNISGARLKIAFLGLGEIGEKCLQAIVDDFEIKFFLIPRNYLSEELKSLAKNYSLRTHEVKNSADIFQLMKKDRIDLMIVAGCPFLLKKDLLDKPDLGVINVHTGALPKYRGFHPLPWAIINDEKRIGVTVHMMDEGMDTGDVLLQDCFEIDESDNISTVRTRACVLGAKLLARVLGNIKDGNLPGKKQDSSQSSYAPRRTPRDSQIDWSRTARDIFNLIRASEGSYAAFSYTQDKKKVSIRKSLIKGGAVTKEQYGEVLDKNDEGYLVGTGDGIIQIETDAVLDIGDKLI